MKKIFTFLFISFCAINISFAQVTQEWVARYIGPNNSNDEPGNIGIDKFNNIIITGRSRNENNHSCFCTIKYNTQGVQQWIQKYSDTYNIQGAHSLAIDTSGNIYVTGNSEHGVPIIKYNNNGVQQWKIICKLDTLNNISANNGFKILLDRENNPVVIVNYHTNYSGDDYVIIKYSQNGDSLWVRKYNGPENQHDLPQDMTVDKYGNIYAIGSSYKYNFIIKYKPNGDTAWSRRYLPVNAQYGYPQSIALDSKGNVCVTGYTYFGAVGSFYLTVKYDSNGVFKWSRIYDGFGTSNASRGICVDSKDNIIVTGNISDMIISDIFTIKYDSKGEILWTGRYSGLHGGYNVGGNLVTDSFNNIYITGSTYGGGAQNNSDYCTIKYNQYGNILWVMNYDGPIGGLRDNAYDIVLDKENNVIVSGSSLGSSGISSDYDYATIKYSQFVGVNPISSNIPDRFELYQNYPNPFNPSTKIRYQIPLSRGVDSDGALADIGGRGVFVKLAVFDILGKEVTTLVNEQKKPGTYEVEWNGTNYSSGLYFYKLIADGVVVDTKKLVLLK
ncbi:MAG: T9SS C-terminal target domain-containing protein [Ignavibacteriae bacterium]|nr:MAG: T9SS C-terminal target domain-containing protein [Ignavibacteriota bacterium]